MLSMLLQDCLPQFLSSIKLSSIGHTFIKIPVFNELSKGSAAACYCCGGGIADSGTGEPVGRAIEGRFYFPKIRKGRTVSAG